MKGFVAQITEAQVFGLPVGAVAGGAVIGGVVDAVSGTVQGFVPQFPGWTIKALMAALVANWGPRWIGKDMSNIGALFLTYDAVQELFDVRGNVSGFVGQLTGQVRAVATNKENPVAAAPSSIGGGY